ncbi:MAG: sigma-70 family RNA polymerase sigma factor [Myxococcales bacterium FL481]|nr:MAG: sigma-70 family RNA polymerase sigma factor [Myxococcales bacterium FL481]
MSPGTRTLQVVDGGQPSAKRVAGKLAAPRYVPCASDRPVGELVDAMYRHFHPMVFHLALRYGQGNRAWAEDATQEVFIRLFKHARRVNEMENVAGWFYRVTTNLCLNRLRRDKFLGSLPMRAFLEQSQPKPPSPEALGLVRDDLRRVFEIVNHMPPKARACFYMYYCDGKRQAEIGEIIGHSVGYVCKLIQRVEAKIRAAEEQVDE